MKQMQNDYQIQKNAYNDILKRNKTTEEEYKELKNKVTEKER
jgi:hypothetical protein